MSELRVGVQAEGTSMLLSDGSNPSPTPTDLVGLSAAGMPGWVAGVIAVAVVGTILVLLLRLRRTSRLRE